MLKIRTVPQQARLLYLVVLQVRMLYLVMQDANLTVPPNRSCQRLQRKSHNAPLPENVKQSITLNWMMDRAFHHPPRKRCKPNLFRKPSKTVMVAHKKRRQKSSLGTTKGTTGMATMSPTPTLSSSSDSTSTGQHIGTVMVNASADETKTAIAALLSLGGDLPQPDEDDTVENAQLMPINPNMMSTADDSVPSSSASSAKTEIKPAETPASVPVHRRFVTVEYKLKRRIK